MGKPKPTRIVLSCDPEFYWGRPVGYGKRGSFASSFSNVALSQHVLSMSLLLFCIMRATAHIHVHIRLNSDNRLLGILTRKNWPRSSLHSRPDLYLKTCNLPRLPFLLRPRERCKVL